jgi:hypothetical protein
VLKNSWPATIGLVLLAVIFVILAYLYWVGDIQILTREGRGVHHTHGFLFAGLAVLSLVAANFTRPKNQPDF